MKENDKNKISKDDLKMLKELLEKIDTENKVFINTKDILEDKMKDTINKDLNKKNK